MEPGINLDPEQIFVPHDPRYGPFVSSRLRDAMWLALRIANTKDGAHERCRKKACGREGRCHFTFDSLGNGNCPGGISEKVVDQAALMLIFVGRLAEGHADRRREERVSAGDSLLSFRGKAAAAGKVVEWTPFVRQT